MDDFLKNLENYDKHIISLTPKEQEIFKKIAIQVNTIKDDEAKDIIINILYDLLDEYQKNKKNYWSYRSLFKKNNELILPYKIMFEKTIPDRLQLISLIINVINTEKMDYADLAISQIDDIIKSHIALRDSLKKSQHNYKDKFNDINIYISNLKELKEWIELEYDLLTTKQENVYEMVIPEKPPIGNTENKTGSILIGKINNENNKNPTNGGKRKIYKNKRHITHRKLKRKNISRKVRRI